MDRIHGIMIPIINLLPFLMYRDSFYPDRTHRLMRAKTIGIRIPVLTEDQVEDGNPERHEGHPRASAELSEWEDLLLRLKCKGISMDLYSGR